ncbi:hypothetical protein P9112_012102 [Eukaryota sp. TZLM1-RC]
MLSFECDDRVDFGFVPVGVSSERPFSIVNTSSSAITVDAELAYPFSIQPSETTISPYSKLTCTISFYPPECTALINNLVLTLSTTDYPQESRKHSIEITGISKQPFPFLSTTLLDVGTVPPNSSHVKRLFICNKSLVPLYFTIDSISPTQSPTPSTPSETLISHSKVFSLSPQSATVPPNETLAIQVCVNCVSLSSLVISDLFSLSVPGLASPVTFSVKVEVASPQLSLSSSLIDFGSVQKGKVLSYPVTVKNESDFPISFQVFTSPVVSSRSVFKFPVTRWQLSRHQSGSVAVTFNPSNQGNYYQRVYLVPDYSAFVYSLDLLGNCLDPHRSLTTPPLLLPSHLKSYQELHGFIGSPSEELFWLKNQFSFDKSINHGLEELSDPQKMVSLNELILPFGKENFNQEIKSIHSFLEFYSLFPNTKSVKKLKLFNYSNITYTLNISPIKAPFFVTPTRLDVGPREEKEIKVTFYPKFKDELYSENIEIFSTPKFQRSRELVSEPRPSNFLNIPCFGDSFPENISSNNLPIPNVKVSVQRLVFGSTVPNRPVCRTFSIKNDGDCDQFFDILVCNTSKSFSVTPQRGIIPPRTYSIITVQFHPVDRLIDLHHLFHACLLRILLCRSNENPLTLPHHFCPSIELSGTVCKPCIEFSKDSVVFRDTGIGTRSVQVLEVVNVNYDLKVDYCWEFDRNSPFSAQHRNGIVDGNSKEEMSLVFAPEDEGYFTSEAVLFVKSFNYTEKYVIKLSGSSVPSSVSFDFEQFLLGNCLIGSPSIFPLTLHNNSSAPVKCSLMSIIKEKGYEFSGSFAGNNSILDGQINNEDSAHLATVSINPQSITIPAKGFMTVDLNVTPHAVGHISGEVKVILPSVSSSIGFSLTGVYPSLFIDDVAFSRNPLKVVNGQFGINHVLPKSCSSALFNINKINNLLLGIPTKNELLFAESSGFVDKDSSELLSLLKTVEITFPLSQEGEPSSIFEVLIQNVGCVDARISLLSSSSFKVDLEPWAMETVHRGGGDAPLVNDVGEKEGDCSVDDVFDCSSDCFTIEAGNSFILKLSANHSFSGVFKSNIVFKIANGKIFNLELFSATLPKHSSIIDVSQIIYLPLFVTGANQLPVAVDSGIKPSTVDLGDVSIGSKHFFAMTFRNISTIPIRIRLDKGTKSSRQDERPINFKFNSFKDVLLQRNSSGSVCLTLNSDNFGLFSEKIKLWAEFQGFCVEFLLEIKFNVVDLKLYSFPIKPSSMTSFLPVSDNNSWGNLSFSPISLFCSPLPGTIIRKMIQVTNSSSTDHYLFKWRLDSVPIDLNSNISANHSLVTSIFPASGEILPATTVTFTLCVLAGCINEVLDLRLVLTNETLKQKLGGIYDSMRKEYLERDQSDDSGDSDSEGDDELFNDPNHEPLTRRSVHLTATVASVARSRAQIGSVKAPPGYKADTRKFSSKTKGDPHSYPESELCRLKEIASSQTFRSLSRRKHEIGPRRDQSTSGDVSIAKFLPENFGSFSSEDALNSIQAFCSWDVFGCISISPCDVSLNSPIVLPNFSNSEVYFPKIDDRQTKLLHLVVNDLVQSISSTVEPRLLELPFIENPLIGFDSGNFDRHSLLRSHFPNNDNFDKYKNLLGEFQTMCKQHHNTITSTTMVSYNKPTVNKWEFKLLEDVVQNLVRNITLNLNIN